MIMSLFFGKLNIISHFINEYTIELGECKEKSHGNFIFQQKKTTTTKIGERQSFLSHTQYAD